VRLTVGILVLALLALAIAPARADEDTVVITSLSSGVYVEIAEATTVEQIVRLLNPNSTTWTPLASEDQFVDTHLLEVRGTKYYYAAGTGSYAGAVIWKNLGSEQYQISQELNDLLQPSLDRLVVLEGEVGFAKTLQIIAGIALALLVGALFFMGLREERKPQVLR
jgi:hypothetical protein